jgi:RsiW-degrading membrane proteinase PrsW (M82 family)
MMTEDRARIWLVFLSFAIPPIGLVLFFVTRKEHPNTSKFILASSIIGTIFIFLLYTGVIAL